MPCLRRSPHSIYYFLYIGLGLVFVLYGLTIRSLFSFLYHTRRDPAYVWIAYLAWSVFICCILSVFAIEYDLLPHTPELSITQRRPLIDYLYYEIITFTTVGYGDVIPSNCTREAFGYMHSPSGGHARCDVCGANPSRFYTTPTCQKSGMIERPPQPLLPSVGYPMIWSSCIAANSRTAHVCSGPPLLLCPRSRRRRRQAALKPTEFLRPRQAAGRRVTNLSSLWCLGEAIGLVTAPLPTTNSASQLAKVFRAFPAGPISLTLVKV